MTAIAKKLLIGASVLAGMSAANPALAASITNTSLGGTAPSDVLLYCANGEFTVECNAPLSDILQGNSSSPGGNVELAASSERAGFDFSKYTSLTGKVDGRDITLSSLTASDWGGGFAEKWFGEALSANGLDRFFSSSQKTQLFNIFANYGGFQRFSDPNISYVNRDGSTGQVSIGLAGHYQASTLLTQSIDKYVNSITNPVLKAAANNATQNIKSMLATKNIFASEIVKVTYEGQTQLLYSFTPTQSGLVAADDGLSHTGNYEVSLMGTADPEKEVPEPTTMVGGLMALSGMFAAKRKARKKA